LVSNGDLSIGNYDDSDNVIQKVCVDNVGECNDLMSWVINVATVQVISFVLQGIKSL